MSVITEKERQRLDLLGQLLQVNHFDGADPILLPVESDEEKRRYSHGVDENHYDRKHSLDLVAVGAAVDAQTAEW